MSLQAVIDAFADLSDTQRFVVVHRAGMRLQHCAYCNCWIGARICHPTDQAADYEDDDCGCPLMRNPEED